MKKYLASFIGTSRSTVTQLKDMKSIMRVRTARTVSFWLVLPAYGDEDCVCVLIKKIQERKGWINTAAKITENEILKDYADRIINA